MIVLPTAMPTVLGAALVWIVFAPSTASALRLSKLPTPLFVANQTEFVYPPAPVLLIVEPSTHAGWSSISDFDGIAIGLLIANALPLRFGTIQSFPLPAMSVSRPVISTASSMPPVELGE